MEEMREAALAYYANLSDEKKKLAKEFFEEMDESGEGKVSLKEYTDFFKQKGVSEISNSEIFKAMDADGNGNLDFDEFITIFYVYMGNRMMFCKECKTFLNGLYFTCVHCFDGSSDDTFDLCSSCFRNKKFHHHKDAVFLDNFTLLRRKRKPHTPISSQDSPTDKEVVESKEEDGIPTAESTEVEDAIETVAKKDEIHQMVVKKNGIQAVVKKGAVAKFATKYVSQKLLGMGKQYTKSVDIGNSIAAKTSSQLSKIGDKTVDAVSSCNLM